MKARQLGLLAALVLSALGLLASPASAHPLGQFTTNTSDQMVLQADGVEVIHRVDLAELTTVQLNAAWDADRDKRLSPTELAAYAADACSAALPLLALSVDGRDAPLTVTRSAAQPRPGQGGLPTTLLTCDLRSRVDPAGAVTFSDASSEGRTGWREVTAVARCGSVTGSDVPTTSPSALLTRYPVNLLKSPVDVRAASFTSRPGPCAGSAETERAERTALPRGLGGFASSVTNFLGHRDLTLPFALLSALVALVFGAVHALAPGHGKTVVAAYLVGQRGTRRQAVQLGAVVTFTHTSSVLLLGAVLALGALASPERVVPATEVLSGVLLAAVGVYLLVLTVRRRHTEIGGHDHDHPHDHTQSHEHDHPHEHDHDRGDEGHAHDHGRSSDGYPHDDDHEHHDHDHPHHVEHVHEDEQTRPHRELVPVAGAPAVELATDVHGEQAARSRTLPADGRAPVASDAPRFASAPAGAVHSHGGRAHRHDLPAGPLSWRTLAGMGIAGGLVPSPSALVVLLGATYLGRAWFGVVLVLLYGLGMAGTLTIAGLLLLRAQAALDRRGWAFVRSGRLARLLPLATAAIVVGVGLLLIVRGIITNSTLG